MNHSFNVEIAKKEKFGIEKAYSWKTFISGLRRTRQIKEICTKEKFILTIRLKRLQNCFLISKKERLHKSCGKWKMKMAY